MRSTAQGKPRRPPFPIRFGILLAPSITYSSRRPIAFTLYCSPNLNIHEFCYFPSGTSKRRGITSLPNAELPSTIFRGNTSGIAKARGARATCAPCATAPADQRGRCQCTWNGFETITMERKNGLSYNTQAAFSKSSRCSGGRSVHPRVALPCPQPCCRRYSAAVDVQSATRGTGTSNEGNKISLT